MSSARGLKPLVVAPLRSVTTAPIARLQYPLRPRCWCRFRRLFRAAPTAPLP